MTKLSIVAALALALGTSVAFAQNPPPAGGDKPAAAATDKAAIAKSCIDQANAKGLHGKERKKFKRNCKHHGGKPE